MADQQNPQVDFALIGHMETWTKIHKVWNGMRAGAPAMSIEQIRAAIGIMQPRTIGTIDVKSTTSGVTAHGIYVETFITPDDLVGSGLRKSVERVKGAEQCSIDEGARVAALGGFTSIVAEGEMASMPQGITQFTTGNTLTSAFIIEGIKKACRLNGVDLKESSLLIIGGTGDIGSACARYFAHDVKELILCARHRGRLEQHAKRLTEIGANVRISTDFNEVLGDADAIICAASLSDSMIQSSASRPHTVICDAGYPKNTRPLDEGNLDTRVFYGGMGTVNGSVTFTPDFSFTFYEMPNQNVGHGCMLEGILLALSRRYEAYSYGRGNITPERIDELLRLGKEHGIVLAPFFNANGLWPKQ